MVSLVVILLFLLWVIGVNIIGLTGIIEGTPFSRIISGSVVFLSILTLPLIFKGFRERIKSLPLKWLIFVNLSRISGIAYLLLYQRGYFSYSFSIPAGMADISAAVAAFAALMCVPMNTFTKWILVFLWNTLGLAGQVLVIAIGLKIERTEFFTMEAFSHWPLMLLPLMVYPVIVSVHIIVYFKLLQFRFSGK